MLTKAERELLERLAMEGKPMALLMEELCVANALESSGLLFLVGTRAVVTPKARRLLAIVKEVPKGTLLRGF